MYTQISLFHFSATSGAMSSPAPIECASAAPSMPSALPRTVASQFALTAMASLAPGIGTIVAPGMPCAIPRPVASAFAPVGTAVAAGHVGTTAHGIAQASIVRHHASTAAHGIAAASSTVQRTAPTLIPGMHISPTSVNTSFGSSQNLYATTIFSIA
jgi:hypothetical protein